jgi:hypothetical protein
MNSLIVAIEEFLSLTKQARKIADSSLDPKDKHSLIFGHIQEQISASGLPFEYYVPDSSYDEEIVTFVKAMEEQAEKFKTVISREGKPCES